MGGGATVWDGMAYDPETDLFYVGTGNAGPWPEATRKQSKGKDNLFAASIIAVKADTGEYKWHFQLVPGDSWDYDAVQQLILADLPIKGQTRKVIMQASKDGFFYVLDRLTGKFISGQPFVKVSWAKGLNEATGKPIVNDDARYNTENSAVVQPGPNGAHNWSPMSFNPISGLVYIPSTSGITFSYATDPNFVLKPGQLNLGIVFSAPAPPAGRGGANAATQTGGEVATAQAQAAAAPPPPRKAATRKPQPPIIGPELTGNLLIAYDPVAQSVRWSKQGGGSTGGGTLTTAGNLVFQVIPTGMLRVYSADKGELLLELQTNLASAMGPPMTYMLDGKQYVTVQGGQGAAGIG